MMAFDECREQRALPTIPLSLPHGKAGAAVLIACHGRPGFRLDRYRTAFMPSFPDSSGGIMIGKYGEK